MSDVDQKNLRLAIAGFQRLVTEYQEREGLRIVFQSAEKILKTLSDAEGLLPVLAKKKNQIQQETEGLVRGLDQQRKNFDSFLADGAAQRERVQKETAGIFADEKGKQKAAQKKTAEIVEKCALARKEAEDLLASTLAELETAQSALSEIRAKIGKFQELAG
jgi:hypothetical protein